MMIRFAAAALPVLSGVAFAGPFPPPIEPAEQGKLQCYSPNHEKKTCQSLAGYREAGNGVFENFATVLMSPSPASVVMDVVSIVFIRDGRICGMFRQDDIDKATFTVNGAVPAPDQMVAVRLMANTAVSSMTEQEVCTTYAPGGDGFIAKATVNGVARPGSEQKVIWVSPEDGYRVAG